MMTPSTTSTRIDEDRRRTTTTTRITADTGRQLESWPGRLPPEHFRLEPTVFLKTSAVPSLTVKHFCLLYRGLSEQELYERNGLEQLINRN
ncbi:hypothetical protein Trydic_g15817 [Trypoxylus dichotomus]